MVVLNLIREVSRGFWVLQLLFRDVSCKGDDICLDLFWPEACSVTVLGHLCWYFWCNCSFAFTVLYSRSSLQKMSFTTKVASRQCFVVVAAQTAA